MCAALWSRKAAEGPRKGLASRKARGSFCLTRIRSAASVYKNITRIPRQQVCSATGEHAHHPKESLKSRRPEGPGWQTACRSSLAVCKAEMHSMVAHTQLTWPMNAQVDFTSLRPWRHKRLLAAAFGVRREGGAAARREQLSFQSWIFGFRGGKFAEGSRKVRGRAAEGPRKGAEGRKPIRSPVVMSRVCRDKQEEHFIFASAKIFSM